MNDFTERTTIKHRLEVDDRLYMFPILYGIGTENRRCIIKEVTDTEAIGEDAILVRPPRQKPIYKFPREFESPGYAISQIGRKGVEDRMWIVDPKWSKQSR